MGANELFLNFGDMPSTTPSDNGQKRRASKSRKQNNNSADTKATDNGAYSLIGGGDSVACVNKFGMADRVSYISTGGGALLEAIEGKVLPGVAAING